MGSCLLVTSTAGCGSGPTGLHAAKSDIAARGQADGSCILMDLWKASHGAMTRSIKVGGCGGATLMQASSNDRIEPTE